MSDDPRQPAASAAGRSPGDPHRFSADAAELEFRVRTLRTGVWPSIFTSIYLVAYCAVTWGQPHRGVLLILCGLAFLSSVGIAFLPMTRLIGGRGREPFFVG